MPLTPVTGKFICWAAHGDMTEALLSEKTGEAYHRVGDFDAERARPLTFEEATETPSAEDDPSHSLCGPLDIVRIDPPGHKKPQI